MALEELRKNSSKEREGKKKKNPIVLPLVTLVK